MGNEETKNTEQNAPIEGIQVHDIIVVDKSQRTGKDGQKLGYSFYNHKKLGIVVGVSSEKVNIILADNSEYEYSPSEIDEQYYFTISKGSEYEYLQNIKKEVEKEMKNSANALEKVAELNKWHDEVRDSIGVMYKMIRFIKTFVNTK